MYAELEMTSGWLLLIIGILVTWLYSARSMRQELRRQQAEVDRLRKASGSLEDLLAVHGRRLDALMSAMHDAVMRVDRMGRVLAANPRARELFGMERGTELPQSMLVFYRDTDWNRAFSKALKALPEASSMPDIPLSGRILAPQLTPLGQEQALLLCVDMTELYKLEEQRRTFLSNLMHDLKTPLTSLLGYARSLDKFGDDPDFRKEAAQVIGDEAKRVNYLLEALLTLDQIEFSVRDPDAACDAAVVLQKVCDLLRPEAEKKFIELNCDIPNDFPALAIAAPDMERLLVNVLENAVRHSPEHDRVDVYFTQQDDGALITVSDQGLGVPPKKLPRLTERFYRVDRSRKRGKGGHGLGLSIVKELAEWHGGKLELANRVEGGLEVRVELPFHVEEEGDKLS